MGNLTCPSFTFDPNSLKRLNIVLPAETKSALGTVQKIGENDIRLFRDRLLPYISSQQRAQIIEPQLQPQQRKLGTRPALRVEFWPLAKRIRIFTKSPVLDTGAIIVDLPGTEDNNAARAAVSSAYQNQCSSYWIVSPIVRAIDNRAAHDLLGSAFRRQLYMQGSYGSVTFICSKTDSDISVNEMQDEPGMLERLAPLEKEQACLQEELKGVEKTIGRLKKEKKILDKALKAEQESPQQQSVTSPELTLESVAEKDPSSKRTSPVSPRPVDRRECGQDGLPPQKRLCLELSGPSEDRNDPFDISGARDQAPAVDSNTMEPKESGTTVEQPKPPSLQVQETESETSPKELSRLKSLLKELNDRDDTIKALKRDHKRIRKLMADLESRIKIAPIEIRNEYCISKVKDIFANSIADFKASASRIPTENSNDKVSKDGRGASFNAEIIQNVRNNLSVFCISSRGYQSVCGRLNDKDRLEYFQDKDQTSIPAL